MIRVSHVLWSGGIGGIERLVHDLAREQRRQGIDVSVVFGQADGLFTGRLRSEGFEVGDLALRSGWDLRQGALAEGRRLLGERDIVHMHGFNLAFAAVLRGQDPAVVLTEHGHFALGRRLGLSGRVKRLVLNRFLRRRVDVIAANSAHTASQMCDVYRLRLDQVRVVHNGIPPHAEPKPSPERNDARLVVAFVGRLVRFKRIERLIEALALLDEPEQIRALIVGSGPLDGELRELARARGIESAVEFIGAVDDVTPVLREADVIVQPSEGEPFGLSVLEGCEAGCLPIAFADGGGVLEALPRDGLIVGNETELAATLARLPGSEALSSAARRDRAAWAQRAFPIERTCHQYLELYRAALRGRHRRRTVGDRRGALAGEQHRHARAQ
jgi:glycosyltransferase involved in cell wall biosynthesis